MLIYINFSFDFLGLDKVYFKNYFANELIRRSVVFKFSKHSLSCFIRYKTLGCASRFISDKTLLLVF
jgi:hypothetical protein